MGREVGRGWTMMERRWTDGEEMDSDGVGIGAVWTVMRRVGMGQWWVRDEQGMSREAKRVSVFLCNYVTVQHTILIPLHVPASLLHLGWA